MVCQNVSPIFLTLVMLITLNKQEKQWFYWYFDIFFNKVSDHIV